MDASTALKAGLVTSETAQHWFAPEACLFVANLNIHISDHHLRAAVQAAFSHFGQCFVKIRRDPTNLPAAFVQYTTTDDAELASKEGRSIIIAGLSVRIEWAKCDRTLFCTSRSGEELWASEHDELSQMLSQYGQLDDIRQPTSDEVQQYDLPDGFVIRFRHYGSCKDALQALHHHAKYQFRLMRPNRTSYPPFRRARLPHRKHRRTCPALSTGSIIAVDSLPATTTPEQMNEAFSHFGNILRIEVKSQASFSVTGHRAVQRWAAIHYSECWAGPYATAFVHHYGLSLLDIIRGGFVEVGVRTTYCA